MAHSIDVHVVTAVACAGVQRGQHSVSLAGDTSVGIVGLRAGETSLVAVRNGDTLA